GLSKLELKRIESALDAIVSAGNFPAIWSAMHSGIVLGDRKFVDATAVLMERDIINVNVIGPDGATLLHALVRSANKEDPTLAKMPAGSLRNLPVPAGAKPMEKGYMLIDERISLLQRSMADMNSSMHGISALLRRRLRHQGQSAEAICAELKQRGVTDERLLELDACATLSPAEQIELTECVIDAHASPLMHALISSRHDKSREIILQSLLEHGADPASPGLDLRANRYLQRHGLPAMPIMPFHLAAGTARLALVEMFLAVSGKVDQRGEFNETVLHWAAENAAHPEVLQKLLTTQVALHVGARDFNGETALHRAVRVPNNLANVLQLLQAMNPKDVLELSAEGKSVLHLAVEQAGNRDVVAMLLSAGAGHLIHAVTRGTYDKPGPCDPDTGKDGYTALHCAVKFGEAEVARLLLSAGADEGIETTTGPSAKFTALHLAAQSNNLEMVSALVEAGADIEQSTRADQRPLHLAAEAESAAVVGFLLKRGASVSARTTLGESVMHYAARSKNPAILALLIKHGAIGWLNARTHFGELPLHYAGTGVDNLQTVKLMLETVTPAQLGARNNLNESILHRAATVPGNHAILKAFLDAGAGVHINGSTIRPDGNADTPLHYAALMPGNHESVKVLLDAGAGLDTPNRHGRTPLHLAVGATGNAATVLLLLASGANAALVSDGGQSCLQLAAEFTESPAVIAGLVEGGAAIDAADHDGLRVIHYAAKSRHAEVVAAVLEAGAGQDINLPETSTGLTPLMFAAHLGHSLDVMRLLLAAGAEVNTGTSIHRGVTALHLACGGMAEKPATVKLLLESNADVNALAEEPLLPFAENEQEFLEHARRVAAAGEKWGHQGGNTPLRVAVRGGHSHATDLLLLHGAEVNAVDREGNTALILHFQRTFEQYERSFAMNRVMQRMLLEHGAHVHVANVDDDDAFAFAGDAERPDERALDMLDDYS
ncbi:MAG: ankyrin repeat domain-containing protein, partial [Janthinobacterium lividum]